MKRSIAQLKTWFSRGKYPTESQFADWMDSYHHKDEQIQITQVEQLAEQLNAKYSAAAGERLEALERQLRADFDRHKEDADDEFEKIENNRQALVAEDERQQGEIDAVETDIAKIREMLKSGSSLDAARSALVALGQNYMSLHALATTVKTFIEATDTKDTTINTWRELERFLDGVTDSESLAGLLEDMERKITAAYNTAIAEAVNNNAPMVKTTWAHLCEWCRTQMLQPGYLYRITDYETTVANDTEARSAGHPFDVIVLAIDEMTLSEEARAIRSVRDTAGYFDGARLEAWKIWYSLRNDTTHFQWADADNGKGVIYRMIDEWGNDCPYDFKNVQFKRYKVTDNSPHGELADLAGQYIGLNVEMRDLGMDSSDYVWAYTFSLGDREGVPQDASIIGFNSYDAGQGYGNKGYYGDNVIKPTTCHIALDSEQYSVFCLNNVIWFDDNSAYRCQINGNHVGSECINMTLSGHGTHIGHDCQNIITGIRCFGNTLGVGCSMLTFGNDCYNNTFGNDCYNNTFGNDCGGNTFGNYLQSNTFGNSCWYNTFGNSCGGNTFGNYLQYITVNDGVRYVSVSGSVTAGKYVQNAQILNGTAGKSSSNMLEIGFAEAAQYCQYAGLNSAGELRIWTPADLV